MNRSVVIDYLKSECRGNEAVGFFYCDRNESERRNPESVMRAIVKQLSCPRPEMPIPAIIVREYEKRKHDGFSSGHLGLEDSLRLTTQLINSYQQSIIVIDGFDECDPDKRKLLLRSLINLTQSTANISTILKVFISSRDDRDISLWLENHPNIYIKPSDNAGDIERFVRKEVSRRIADQELLEGVVDEALEEKICKRLVEGSNGMYVSITPLFLRSLVQSQVILAD